MDWDNGAVVEHQFPHPFKENSSMTVGILSPLSRSDVSDYTEYCVMSTRSLITGFLSPRFSNWLTEMVKTELPRRILVCSLAAKIELLREFIKMFLEQLSPSEDAIRKIESEMMDWLLPTSSRLVFQGTLLRVFTFSLITYRAGHTNYEEAKETIALRKDAKEMFAETKKLLDAVNSSPLCLSSLLSLPCEGAIQVVGERMINQLSADVTVDCAQERFKECNDIILAWIDVLSLNLDKKWPEIVKDFMEKELIDHLITRIYELTVLDYEYSYSFVECLRVCMARQNGYGRERLIVSLNESVKRRLLHVGISTQEILKAYATSVDALKHMDPSCFIMHRVCSTIKVYLKKRPDTVRQIINLLTTERKSLGDNEIRNKTTMLDEDETAGINDEFLDSTPNKDWILWNPDPPDAIPGDGSRCQRSSDVFTMLISVYGSKESFVKEYRQLLAERLTQAAEKDPAFEMRYLELLKMRFSDGELQQCEVMLKDVRDSERIDKDVSTRMTLPLSCRIVSSHFWPKIDNDKVVELPPIVEEGMKQYETEYSAIKSGRHLKWIRGSGCVELSLSIDGIDVKKVVSHANAAVIYLFLEKEKWSASEVADALQISRGGALRRLEWWQSQGVLVHGSSEIWALTSQAGNIERFKTSSQELEEEGDSDVGGDTMDTGDALEELEQYWQYTVNLINSQAHGEAKAERLFTIYKMFSTSAPLSLDNVVSFLQRKVRLGLLEFNNGFYRLHPDLAAKTKK